MALGKRLDKLEGFRQLEDFKPLFIATEITPSRYKLNDGRELSEAELEALPNCGLILCLLPGNNEA